MSRFDSTVTVSGRMVEVFRRPVIEGLPVGNVIRSLSTEVRTEQDYRAAAARRARKHIRRFVAANDALPKNNKGVYRSQFVTFTCADDITDLDVVRGFWRDCVERLRDTDLFGGDAPMYVVVPEIQKERLERTGKAVWHLHAVFFNSRYVDLSDDKEKAIKMWEGAWMRGGIKPETVGKKLSDLTGYLAKYISKDFYSENRKGRRSYWISKNLVAPMVRRFDVDTVPLERILRERGTLMYVNVFDLAGFGFCNFEIWDCELPWYELRCGACGDFWCEGC